jgi:hypothetical protein
VVVARPSRWGNPHRIEAHTPEAHRVSVEAFRDDLVADRLTFFVAEVRRQLAGRDLCCWCAPELACHADVLLEVANTDDVAGLLADRRPPSAGRRRGGAAVSAQPQLEG